MAGISPTPVQYAREIHTMLALVGVGLGVALVPEVAGTPGLPGVELRPIALTPEVFSELEINEILSEPETRDRLIAEGAEVSPMTVERFTAFAEAESEKYARIIKDTGVEPE